MAGDAITPYGNFRLSPPASDAETLTTPETRVGSQSFGGADEGHGHPALQVADAAIVHDWLPGLTGAERVVQQMIRVLPGATLYTLFDFLSEAERAELSQGLPIHVSRLNNLPGVARYYRYLLLSCTRAIEEFDLTRHHFVLSSSAALAKGVLTTPEQVHFAYVHTPARYAWDLSHEYVNNISGLGAALKRHVARRVMHRFRQWDMRTAPSVDHFIANSEFIKKRIWKVYRREADVIYPPVNTDGFTISQAPREDYFVTASRLVPYKRMAMIAEAFSQRPDLKLKVIGEGPEMAAVRAAAGPNVEVMGHLPFEEMKHQMQHARAFVFAAKEDFGITPLEAQACGTPVIALSHGGTAETVRPLGQDAPTGVWFEEQTIASLLGAVDQFVHEGEAIRAEDCRANALTFDESRFRAVLATYMAERLA